VKRILTLLRHGEAEIGHGMREDYARILTGYGASQLTRLGNVLESRQISFDLTLYSPAIRTTQTMEILDRKLELGVKISDRGIYESSLAELLRVVQKLPPTYYQVLLVGHNPGITHLQGYLSGDSSIMFSPGMLVRMSLDVEGWDLVYRSSATLLEVIQ
jgi:phosphohistidine phosphatase